MPEVRTYRLERSNLSKYVCYADDFNVVITEDTWSEVMQSYAVVSKEMTDWVKANALLINVKKTKYKLCGIYTQPQSYLLTYNTYGCMCSTQKWFF